MRTDDVVAILRRGRARTSFVDGRERTRWTTSTEG